MTRAISRKGRERVVSEYGLNQKTMIELSGELRISRQAVWKILKDSGVDTRKRKLPVRCYWCEKEFLRTKGRLRKNVRNFCSEDCYMGWLGELGADYKQNRQGQRIARGVVLKHFELQDGNIVHHEDKNTLNNMLHNLKVFANNGDHVRYHRRVSGVGPIWSGEKSVVSSYFKPMLKGVKK